MKTFLYLALIGAAMLTGPNVADAANAPTREHAVDALNKAVRFFRSKVATHGGYVWRYSSDLRYRQGEGLAYDERIWVQPPGTPAVGLAFLDAYEATDNPLHLDAAREAADALVQGQLHSGGWFYSTTFDTDKRRAIHYRKPPSQGEPNVRTDPDSPGGWTVWKQGRYKSNMTVLDDDTTQSALRFLMRVDEVLDSQDERIHEAVEYGLASLLKAQYPVGAWSHNYDRFPQERPSAAYYLATPASYPDSWSRDWTKDYAGCYVINDRITLNAIHTMLDAYEAYRKRDYLDAALRGGDFLLLARLPAPQPAWAQQYDRHMQPVWDRPFEPPAITGLESQDVLETLLLL
ncbi:MAG: pectate lyase [Planctomycetota bacterium]